LAESIRVSKSAAQAGNSPAGTPEAAVGRQEKCDSRSSLHRAASMEKSRLAVDCAGTLLREQPLERRLQPDQRPLLRQVNANAVAGVVESVEANLVGVEILIVLRVQARNTDEDGKGYQGGEPPGPVPRRDSVDERCP
jgi:hypothetical protein